MQINFNVISIIEIIGLVQGLVLGSILLFVNRKKIKSTTFLGLFVLVYSFNLISNILDDLNILEFYPKLLLLPIDFYWLEFPLFYIYVRKISIISDRNINYWVLYPGIASVLVNVILFLLPLESRIVMANSIVYYLYIYVGILFSLYIGIITIKWINIHLHEVQNQFSNIEYKELSWARLFVVMGFIFVVVSLTTSIFIGDNYVFKLIEQIINIAMLYWISLRGIMQQNVHSVITYSNKNEEKTIPHINNNDVNVTSISENDPILIKLRKYIVEEEAYMQANLTIIDVANNIGEHPKRISYLINSYLNNNFNNYINTFRIEKAKELLDNSANNYSVEGIGFEVGFKSKSSFYNAFKKIVGTTPSKYKNQKH